MLKVVERGVASKAERGVSKVDIEEHASTTCGEVERDFARR